MYAVVDTETTGLYNSDRVVEIAIVVVDDSGNVLEEWDTLVNPERDVGPVEIHGVTATMVAAAPTFEDVRGAVADRLDGAVLVAHNLQFDERMLSNEFERSAGAWSPGSGSCTQRATGRRLSQACADNGIEIEQQHRALADARATAALFSSVINGREAGAVVPAKVEKVANPSARTVRREAFNENVPERSVSGISRWAEAMDFRRYRNDEWGYVGLLDRALDDLWLSAEERVQLAQLAEVAGIAHNRLPQVHKMYLDELYKAAMRDSVIVDEEFRQLDAVADALGFRLSVLYPDLEQYRPSAPLVTAVTAPGCRVAFTGAAVSPTTGEKLDRSKLSVLAIAAGFEPQPSLTKSGTDLLVAADTSTQSGKAKKAAQWGIPMMSVEEFVLHCARP